MDLKMIPTEHAILRINSTAKYPIGNQVKHRIFGFRGVIFDVDPVFANSEEWYESIPENVRPKRDQPFYHLFAEAPNKAPYVAYVSEQNLVEDEVSPLVSQRLRTFLKTLLMADLSCGINLTNNAFD